MLVAISRMVSRHGYAWLSPNHSSPKRLLCLALLVPATTICLPLLVQAQQNDVSVLVAEGSANLAATNAPVELPQASSSKPSFNTIPVSNRPFAAPLPPASLLEDSKSANFRYSAPNTLTATAVPSRDNQTSFSGKSAVAQLATERSESTTSAASGTFASRLPSDVGLQQQGEFGSSRASADLRFDNTSGSATRNRFGDFGTSPGSNAGSRFVPISSNQSQQNNQTSSAPPVRPARNSFTPPAVVPATATQPVRPTPPSDRFKAPPLSKSSNGFSPPVASKAFPTQPTARPPAATQLASRPQPSGQSLLPPASRLQSNDRFPTRNEKLAAPASSRPTLQDSFGASSQPSNSLSSRSGESNRQSASTPMIRRQTSPSSSQSSSDSLRKSQSNLVSTRLSPQTSQFGQSTRQPLRGRPVENELRGAKSGQASIAQQGSNVNRFSGQVNRQTIDFAQQQLRNIQAVSAGENGTPVRLVEMFLEPLSVSQRKQMVAQYWETYYDLAALKIASDYEKWLSSISTSTGAEKGLLTAAQQMAVDGQLAAKIQLGKSQSRLLDFMPNPRANDFAPLPADEPLVERYVTDYEKYKRVRSLPSSLRGIDPMLASTLKLITQRAATVSTAKAAADQAGQAVRSRQIPLASAIAAGRIWRDSQLDMVASTVSYNQAISDFVLTLESNRSPEQLTAFMLGAPKSNSQTNTAPVSARPTRNASNVQGWPQSQQHFR